MLASLLRSRVRHLLTSYSVRHARVVGEGLDCLFSGGVLRSRVHDAMIMSYYLIYLLSASVSTARVEGSSYDLCSVCPAGLRAHHVYLEGYIDNGVAVVQKTRSNDHPPSQHSTSSRRPPGMHSMQALTTIAISAHGARVDWPCVASPSCTCQPCTATSFTA